jgi:hypothetical protein
LRIANGTLLPGRGAFVFSESPEGRGERGFYRLRLLRLASDSAIAIACLRRAEATRKGFCYVVWAGDDGR